MTETIPKPSLRGENTPAEIERGKAFGLWLRTARARRGFNKTEAAKAAGISPQYLGLLENDGINHAGVYQRPSEDVVRKLALALNASEDEGRMAAGYSYKQPTGRDLSMRFSNLPEGRRRIIEELMDSWEA